MPMDSGIEVYVYTRMPNGVVLNHHGILIKGKKKARFNNLHSSHWMVNLSNAEGEVRGHSVWFLKPDRQRAVNALDAKDKERTERLLKKANRTLERMNV